MDHDQISRTTSVHAFYGAILCKLCGRKFTPRRRDQTFCHSACRKKYHELAYRIGSLLFENFKRDHTLAEILIGMKMKS